jgi:Bacterial extracellular solute-binding protein/Oxidoreductase family, NAD-binding Rossmann fold
MGKGQKIFISHLTNNHLLEPGSIKGRLDTSSSKKRTERSQNMKIINGHRASYPIHLVAAIGHLTTLLLLLVSFGVGFSPTCACAEDKAVELKFTFWGSPFEKQAIEKAVASFNASHPNIHVTAQHTPYEAYGEKLSAMLAAGAPPDVAYLDFAQAFPFADGGKIMDLTSYFAKQPRDQSVLETSFYRFDHGKKLMGTGLATGIVLLYYNKSLFDAAKLPYPPAKAEEAWTWNKFIEVAKKLTKDRNGNDATSPKFDPDKIETYGASIPQDWWSYLTFIYSNGGQFANQEGTELLLNRPEAVEVLQALQDAIFVYHIGPTPTQNKALGSLGKRGTEVLSHAPGINIVTFVDPLIGMDGIFPWLTDYPQIPQVQTLDALLDNKVDALVVTASSPAHAEIVQKALEFGLHVLVEKPFATQLPEARALVDLAREKGRILMVSQNYRFFPGVQTVRSMKKSGELVH